MEKFFLYNYFTQIFTNCKGVVGNQIMSRKFLLLFIIVCFATPSFAGVRTNKGVHNIDDAVGQVVIKDGQKATAREEAKRLAYRDAIEKAMGASVAGIDQMEGYSSIRDRLVSNANGLVKNFKITNESIEGDTLTITGSCQVSERSLDGFLGPEVISMLGNPRVMILADKDSEKNAGLIENELGKIFEKAGYLIVDADQAKTLIALDPQKAFSDPEMLEGAAKTIKADIIVIGKATGGSSSFNRYGVKIYNVSASAQVKAVLTKTAYRISSQTVSAGKKNSLQGGVSVFLASCLDRAAEEIIYKIAYNLASAGSALGGITVNIKIANASFKEVEEIEEKLREFAGGNGHLFERSYENGMLEIDLVSGKTARNVASFLSDFTNVEGLTAQTINARMIRTAAAPIVETVGESKTINIRIENISDFESAIPVENLLRDFIGATGEVKSMFEGTALEVTITYAPGAKDTKSAQAIAMFLQKNDIRIDKVQDDSITAWRQPKGWFNF